MGAAKRFGLGVLASLFILCLVAVASLTAFNRLFGSSQTVKSTLQKGQVYDKFANAIAEQAARGDQNAQDQTGKPTLSSDAAQEVVTKVITPVKLQGYVEQVVDGTYTWLEGDADKPTYSLDLSSLKQELGVAAGDSAAARLKGLPVCTAAQLRTINPKKADLFTLPCRPPGLNIAAERQKLVSDITNGQDVLEDTQITADDIRSDDQGSVSPFEKFSIVPTIYQWGKVLPWVVGGTALLAGAGMVYLNPDRRAGQKAVAKTLLTIGLLLVISFGVSTFMMNRIQPNTQEADTQPMQEAMISLIQTLSRSFGRVVLVFGVVYTAAGAGGLTALRRGKPVAKPMAMAKTRTTSRPKV
jgi:hypothetical protein